MSEENIKKVNEEDLDKVSGGRATEIQTSFLHTRPNGSDFWTVDANVSYDPDVKRTDGVKPASAGNESP